MIDIMTSSVRVHRAMLHCGDDVGAGSVRYNDVSAALTELVGDEFVMAQIERPEGRFTLIIDADWISFMQQLVGSSQDLVDAGDLPRSMVRAVVAGWPCEWSETGFEVEINDAADGVPHLRLVGSQARSA